MTVWQDVESLRAFVFRSEHVAFLRRRAEWFEKLAGPPTVLWWIPAGNRPTLAEAKDRLDLVARWGPPRRRSPSPTPSARTASRCAVPSPDSAMQDPVRILVVGLGNMGRSHALAYHRLGGFSIVGLASRTSGSNVGRLPAELQTYPLFEDYEQALGETRPDAVSINTYTDTHAAYAIRAMDAGCHVFVEKPLATNSPTPRPWSPGPRPPAASSCSATSCASIRPGRS